MEVTACGHECIMLIEDVSELLSDLLDAAPADVASSRFGRTFLLRCRGLIADRLP